MENGSGADVATHAATRGGGIPRLVVTYVVAAWLTLQAADLLAPRIGLGERAQQAILALLIACFPIALLLTGVAALRRDPARGSRGRFIAIGTAASVLCLLLAGWVWRQAPAASNDGRPLVLMMDSPHAARVYDPETLAENGTNADVVSDILLDLPVHRQKETIGPYWHRDEEIRQFHPDLILIHWSGFCQDECDPERARLRQFIEYMSDTKAQFLIYSRQPADSLPVRVGRMLNSIPGVDAALRARVHTFALDSTRGIPPHWRNPITANELKVHVRRILELD